MSYSITILERMILEDLNSSSKSILELIRSTALNKGLIQNILKSLLTKNLVIIKDNKYSLNKNLNKTISSDLNKNEDIEVEINEITSACFKLRAKETNFKLKKVFMSDKDEKILNGLLYNIEAFIDGLKSQKREITNKKIIFWGGGSYGEIINHSINN